jgi:hypothetical protein
MSHYRGLPALAAAVFQRAPRLSRLEFLTLQVWQNLDDPASDEDEEGQPAPPPQPAFPAPADFPELTLFYYSTSGAFGPLQVLAPSRDSAAMLWQA